MPGGEGGEGGNMIWDTRYPVRVTKELRVPGRAELTSVLITKHVGGLAVSSGPLLLPCKELRVRL